MLTVNKLLKRLKRMMPTPIFEAVDTDFYVEILLEETLPLFSSYYPKLERGIVVTRENAVKVINRSNNKEAFNKYIIPMKDDLYPYIGIAVSYYPLNKTGGSLYNPSLTQVAIEKVWAASNSVTSKYALEFEEPNIINIDPDPMMHVDFTLTMHRVRKLEEIKNGYHDLVKQLFEADVKIALYNKLYAAADGGTFGGIEIKDYLSDFKDYEGKREEIIEKFEEDYYKDPDRFEEIFLET